MQLAQPRRADHLAGSWREVPLDLKLHDGVDRQTVELIAQRALEGLGGETRSVHSDHFHGPRRQLVEPPIHEPAAGCPVGLDSEEQIPFGLVPLGEAGPLDRPGIEDRRSEGSTGQIAGQNLGPVDVAVAV